MSENRKRRTSDEVRDLAVDSARALFTELGFEATSTKAICEKAGISESLLFRHFGSKSALFEEAVLLPFAALTEAFVTQWVARRPSDAVPEQLATAFVSEFFDMCQQNLELVTALNGAESTRRTLDMLASQMRAFHAAVGFVPPADPDVTARLAIALIVGAAELGTEYLGMSRSESVTELSAFVVRGAGYPGSGYMPGGSTRTPNEVVDAYFTAVRNKDVDTLRDLFADEVEFVVGGVTLSSKDEVADFYRATLNERSPQPQPGPPVITGNRVAVEIELIMDGQTYRVADFFSFDPDGHITRLIAYPLM